MGHSRSLTHATNDADCVESANINRVSKNVQSVRAQSRFEDFLAERDDATFDVRFLSETWRDDTEEFFVSPKGAHFFLSGGTDSKGVGMCGQLMYIFICKQLRMPSGQGNGLSVISKCPCCFVLSCSMLL